MDAKNQWFRELTIWDKKTLVRNNAVCTEKNYK